jgi:hypothetical protein
MTSTQAIGRGLALLLACGLVTACAAAPGTRSTSGAQAAATAAPSVAASSRQSSGSLTPSAGATSPSARVIALPFGCGHDGPCDLEAGTYETSGRWAFMRGMQVTVPAGWFSDEQDAGEFNLHPVGQPDSAVFFWKDMSATANDPAGTPLPGVSTTATGLVSWLTSSSDLVVTQPRPTMIGQVPMVTVDVQVSGTAKNVGSDCPVKPCVGFIRDMKHWDGPFSLFNGEVLRMYFGTIGDAGHPHTFVVAIDAPGPPPQGPALAAFTERARPILDSVVIPDVIVDN